METTHARLGGEQLVLLAVHGPPQRQEFCARDKSDYWGQVDLYVGGAEHTTGHLLYARFGPNSCTTAGTSASTNRSKG